MITVGDQKINWKEGITVSQVLTQLKDGHLYAVVKLNNALISKPNFETTFVPDNSDIVLIPMIAGG